MGVVVVAVVVVVAAVVVAVAVRGRGSGRDPMAELLIITRPGPDYFPDTS